MTSCIPVVMGNLLPLTRTLNGTLPFLKN